MRECVRRTIVSVMLLNYCFFFHYEILNNYIIIGRTPTGDPGGESTMELQIQSRLGRARLLARRQMPKEIIRNRALPIGEQCGNFTDVDEASELPTSKYFTREDPKRHWTKKERKRYLEKLRRKKIEAIQMKTGQIDENKYNDVSEGKKKKTMKSH